MKVWVLTSEHNSYDQYGEYFEAVFANKPNDSQLSALGIPGVTIDHVLLGGGRLGKEDEWWYLREVLLEKTK